MRMVRVGVVLFRLGCTEAVDLARTAAIQAQQFVGLNVGQVSSSLGFATGLECFAGRGRRARWGEAHPSGSEPRGQSSL